VERKGEGILALAKRCEGKEERFRRRRKILVPVVEASLGIHGHC
jgi:hypothetical protein